MTHGIIIHSLVFARHIREFPDRKWFLAEHPSVFSYWPATDARFAVTDKLTSAASVLDTRLLRWMLVVDGVPLLERGKKNRK